MESIVAKLDAALYPAVCSVNTYLSNYILVFLLVAVGLWYSIKTRFVQVRCFGEGMRRVFGNLTLNGKKHDSGMSSFQALATAIAAQVGTGNIVGASGAILTGGPGAIFWMWVIAFFGMATIYAEATLAQKTRIVEPDGNIKGGPVYYITTAFKGGFGKFLAGFFAVSIILALGFMGCMVQSNSIGSTMQTAFGIPSWIVGIVLVIICAIIFLGGVQRLAAVTEKLVEAGVRVALDDDNQKIGYKIRAAQQVDRVPYMLVLGAKEAEAGNISVRDRKGETTEMSLEDFIAKVTTEIRTRSL